LDSLPLVLDDALAVTHELQQDKLLEHRRTQVEGESGLGQSGHLICLVRPELGERVDRRLPRFRPDSPRRSGRS